MLRRVPSREWVATGAMPLLVKELRLPCFPWLWHLHQELELTLIIAGTGRRVVADRVETYAAGDCVLLGPDLPHTWVSDPADGPVQAVVVQFTPELAGPAARPLLSALARRAAGGLRITGPVRERVAGTMQAMARCRHPLDRLGRCLTVLSWIAESDAPSLGAVVAGQAAPDDPVLGPVLAHVREHLDEALTQSACARRAGLSPAAFARACRRRLGTTFRDYLAAQRLALACRRLASTDDAITAVAAGSGFANLANFNRRFLRHLGMTPSVYRRRARG